MSQLLFLRIHKGNSLLGIRQFQDAQVIIGSGQAQLQLEGDSVSAVHAMIERRGDDYFISDLGSSQGTFRNGVKVVEEPILPGDQIVIGDFKIEIAIGIPKFKAPGEATAIRPTAVPPKAATPTPVEEVEESPISMAATTSETAVPKELKLKSVTPPKSASKPAAKPVSASKPSSVPKPPSRSSVSASSSVEFHTPETKKKAPPPMKNGHKAEGGTFAPPDQISLKKNLKAEKGNAVEVSVAWSDRIVSTQVFDTQGVVTIGSHPSCNIMLPVFAGDSFRHPILNLGADALIMLTSSMDIELNDGQKWQSSKDLSKSSRLTASGSGQSIALRQGELALVRVAKDVSLCFRYTTSNDKPVAAPFFDLSTAELAAMLIVLVMSALLGLYFTVYTPPIPEEAKEVERKAVFIYQPRIEAPPPEPKATPVPTPVATATPVPTPPPQKVKVDLDKPTTKRAAEIGGAASDAPKNNSKSTQKIPTTANAGQDKGIKKGGGEKAPKPVAEEAKAANSGKSASASGLLSVFAAKGTQAQLQKTNEGSGSMANMAKGAGGSGGQAAGAGWEPGMGTKDLGASGKGTSTYGISGVQTKGRGSGLSGYGEGTLGDKKGAAVVPGGDGEEFTGNLDKDGIRRVIQRNKNQLKNCYDRGLARDAGLHGKVVLTWDIDDKGAVVKTPSVRSNMGDKQVEDCIARTLKGWQFPPSPPGVVGEVTYPFVFSAQ